MELKIQIVLMCSIIICFTSYALEDMFTISKACVMCLVENKIIKFLEQNWYHQTVSGTVGPPLSKPSLIQTLFRILKSRKIVRFSANQVINEMPVWFLDFYTIVQWIEKHIISMCNIIGDPCNWLTIMYKNIITYSQLAK